MVTYLLQSAPDVLPCKTMLLSAFGCQTHKLLHDYVCRGNSTLLIVLEVVKEFETMQMY